jgi:hypothetical protein
MPRSFGMEHLGKAGNAVCNSRHSCNDPSRSSSSIIDTLATTSVPGSKTRHSETVATQLQDEKIESRQKRLHVPSMLGTNGPVDLQVVWPPI